MIYWGRVCEKARDDYWIYHIMLCLFWFIELKNQQHGNGYSRFTNSSWCLQLLSGKSQIPRTMAGHIQISGWTYTRDASILQRPLWFWKLVNLKAFFLEKRLVSDEIFWWTKFNLCMCWWHTIFILQRKKMLQLNVMLSWILWNELNYLGKL